MYFTKTGREERTGSQKVSITSLDMLLLLIEKKLLRNKVYFCVPKINDQ